MKGSENFKNTINTYLQNLAANNPVFAKTFAKPNKNIDDCITFILNAVKATGCHGFEDDEIYGMALHYYDEDDIDVGKPMNCKVVVNHTVQLTDEEVQEQKKKAKDKLFAEEIERQRKKKTPKKSTDTTNTQPSLF